MDKLNNEILKKNVFISMRKHLTLIARKIKKIHVQQPVRKKL